MCGINGLISPHQNHELNISYVKKMSEQLIHRGPDSGGTWSFDDRLYFGHRRLSIIDLSEAGAQPMTSQSGQSALVLNGEIYNFKELSNELGISLRGQSDTEVLVEYIEKFGIDQALKNIRGMFAFAFYNMRDNELCLARDAFGEKPLYFGQMQGYFLFASELKAFHAIDELQLEIDPESLGLYLRYNYVPSPKCIYKNLFKLMPGHYLKFHIQHYNRPPEQKPYFNPRPNQFLENLDEADVLNQTERLLKKSIERQMVADVPLGVFLSSGVDSSLVAAMMREFSSDRVRSFTIGFDIEDYDESNAAQRIAGILGLEHTEYICESSDLLAQVEKLSDVYDEPFSDSSQIPTLLLAEITKRSVTVALSGDGGDEVFAGYNRYQWLEKTQRLTSKLPGFLRPGAAKSLSFLNRIGLAKTIPLPYVSNKIDKLESLIKTNSLAEAYAVVTEINHLDGLYQGASQPVQSRNIQRTEDLIFEDIRSYLPDDILTKVDRATMAHSLESRAPYLDRDLYEYTSQLPLNFKIRNGDLKWPLRKLLKQFLPDEITKASKKGFAVPLDSWFRNELREWVFDSLSETELEKHHFFNKSLVRQYLEEHMSGKRNWQFQLWNLLVFQSWFKRWS